MTGDLGPEGLLQFKLHRYRGFCCPGAVPPLPRVTIEPEHLAEFDPIRVWQPSSLRLPLSHSCRPSARNSERKKSWNQGTSDGPRVAAAARAGPPPMRPDQGFLRFRPRRRSRSRKSRTLARFQPSQRRALLQRPWNSPIEALHCPPTARCSVRHLAFQRTPNQEKLCRQIHPANTF